MTVFEWDSPSCEEREASEKFKMKICLQRESNKRPLVLQAGALDLGHTLTDELF